MVVKFHYDVAQNGAQRCEQKWNNLYRKYKDFVKDCEKTGSGAEVLDRKPPYHDEILEILGKLE